MTIADTLEHGFLIPQVTAALEMQRDRVKLLADHPGSGKTLQALLAAELDGLFVSPSAMLILCNVTGCQLTWAPEIRRRVLSQYPEVIFADLTDTGGRKTMPSIAARNRVLGERYLSAILEERPLIVLANYDLIEWARSGVGTKIPAMFDIEYDCVVIDEAHLVLPTEYDKDSQQTLFWRGLNRLKISDRAMRLALTGTPDRGKLHNRYGHWKFLYPGKFVNRQAWVDHFFAVQWEERGWNARAGRPYRVPSIIGLHQHREGEWIASERNRVIRRTKQEMWAGMPDKQWAGDGGIDLELTAVQRAAYEQFMDDTYARIDELRASGDDSAQRVIAGLRLQAVLRARQLANAPRRFETVTDARGREHVRASIDATAEDSVKMQWILEWLRPRGYYPGEDYRDDGGKVVIVSFFTEDLRWIKDRLADVGVEAEILMGSTPAPEKQHIQQAFQNDYQPGGLRVVLLSGDLGTSISLDAADDMIFYDMVPDPDRMEQAEDRAHRASRPHALTIWRLIARDTIDASIVATIDYRYETTRALMDGSRGVRFARMLLGTEMSEA